MKLHDVARFPGLYAIGFMFLMWQGCDDDSGETRGGLGSDASDPDAATGVDAATGGPIDASHDDGGSGGAGAGGAGGQIAAAGEGGASGAGGTGGVAAGAGGSSGSGGKAGGSGRAGAGSAGKAGSTAAGEGGSDGSAGAAGGGGSAGDNAGAGGAAGGGGSAGGEAGVGGAAAGSGGSAGGPASERCGTRGGATCDDDEYCDYEPDAECGATDRGGVCRAKPDVCTEEYDPVCGCDDHTYGNACAAHAAGISVKRDGLCSPEECRQAGGRAEFSDGASIPECEQGEQMWSISGGDEPVVCCLSDSPSGRTCGGIAALECGDGEFCNYEESAGGQGCDGTVSDAGGVCQSIPAACTRDYRPVCGCDKRTYGNACEAHSNGMSILHEGACNALDCASIAGRVVYGIGPEPMCAPGEDEYTFVIDEDGALPIEGAICCVPQQ